MELYRVPFDTNTHPIRISQGRLGPWSHFMHESANNDLENAVDFALPLGTPVLAARSGRLMSVFLEGDWCYEGLNAEIGNNPPPGSTNFVAVEHADETIAIYSHLSRERVHLESSIISVGDVIGFTGKSGWIAEVPHLHFQVIKLPGRRTLPVFFENYHGPLIHAELERLGLVYRG